VPSEEVKSPASAGKPHTRYSEPATGEYVEEEEEGVAKGGVRGTGASGSLMECIKQVRTANTGRQGRFMQGD
jgi:hypothetical protein